MAEFFSKFRPLYLMYAYWEISFFVKLSNSAPSCSCVSPTASSPVVLWCVSGFCCPHAVISY